MQQGRRSRTPRIELYWASNALGHPRLAVVVPRYGATAVARNRLRRRLRERARRHVLSALVDLDLVIRARQAAYDAAFRDLAEDMERWVRSARG